MISSIGQAVALTTFANAACAGHEVSFFIEGHPWFAHTEYMWFRIGDDPARVIARDVPTWLGRLRASGFGRAYLWFEPPSGARLSEIQSLAFAGASRWAPVTCGENLEVIWHERVEIDRTNKDKPWKLLRGGFAVQPGQASLTSTPEDASQSLTEALRQMTLFQERYRPKEPFGDMFRTGIEILASSQRWHENVDSLFPADLYPDESYRLVGAVNAAWALGGMGWWSDWSSPDPDIQGDYEDVTKDYYAAMGKALFAACNVTLVAIRAQ